MNYRPRIITTALLLLLFSRAPFWAVEYHGGMKLSINGAIGTGKGFWDWYGADANTKRSLSPLPAGALLLQRDSEENWSLESGVGYYRNHCLLKVDGEEFCYEQPSWEIPLLLKLYLNNEKLRTYLKFGTAAVILTDQASFENSDGSMILINDSSPEDTFHMGLNGGFGLEYRNRAGIWLLDLQYATFYSSPEYSRTDGSIGNIRFHRFELGLGYMF